MATQTIADMNGRREFPGEAAQLGDWFYRSASAEAFLTPSQASDAGPLLSQVRAPTLVLHRIADSAIPFAAGQKLAAGIPGARFVPLEGKGHLFCLGDYGNILAAVDEVLGDRVGAPARLPSGTRVGAHTQGMAVVLFTDIADSVSITERMGDAGFRAASRTLEEHIRLGIREAGGKPVEGKVLGDGVMGVFASAAQAIAAARVCADAASSAELPLHIGLHAGDVIHEKDNVYGGAVNIASRICGLCAPGEILVSQTVRDLARTSARVTFEDRSEHALKGIADPVRVFAVLPEGATRSVPQGTVDTIAILEREFVEVRVQREDLRKDGVCAIEQLATELAAGLCPKELGSRWQWHGPFKWDELQRFCGRLKILGLVELRTREHPFANGETELWETFYLNDEGAKVIREIGTAR
jgi:class 3 adenylate cyclase